MSSSQPSPDSPARRWAVLVCALVLLLFLGLIYAWSNFVTPLEADFGWNRADTSLAFTWCMSFFCIGGFVSGLLSRRISPRVNLLLAALFVAGGFLAASRLTTLTGLYLCYGVLVGFGIGIAYNTVISTGMRWFAHRPGFASGVMLMGFGLGGMVLGTACTSLIRHFGWRTTFGAIGIAFGGLVVAASLVIRLPGAPARGQGSPELAGHTTTHMLRAPSFWMLYVWGILICAACLAVIGNASPLALGMGVTTETAAVLTGAISLFNGGSRILTGLLYDRADYRKVITLISLVAVAALAISLLALWVASLPLLILGFALTGLAFGGSPITASTLAGKFYGRKHYSVNYALLNTNLLPASFAGPFLAGNLQASSGSFLSTAAVMTAFAVAAALLSRLIRQPKPQ